MNVPGNTRIIPGNTKVATGNTKLIPGAIAVVVVACSIISLIVYLVQGMNRMTSSVDGIVTTTGVVNSIATGAVMGYSSGYRFTVSGKEYTGLSEDDVARKIGDTIKIDYVPSDPSVNSYNSGSKWYKKNLFVFICICILTLSSSSSIAFIMF